MFASINYMNRESTLLIIDIRFLGADIDQMSKDIGLKVNYIDKKTSNRGWKRGYGGLISSYRG